MTRPSLLAAVLAVSSLALAGTAAADKKKPPTSPPRVSLEAARATALKQVPGVVLEEELETRKGAWVYEFEIRPSGAEARTVLEVEIDGNTGAVIKIEDDSADRRGD